ncbi:MAG: anthranilate/aminodeoxychorismate synthase component II [Dehalococcoidaceae bacterium]|nr:anthranilate/aminodeoxychorismate synthase component II [Dehalococcoidaceae bacterium]
MILIIDNYDSFTYNLFQYFSELSDLSIQVVRNDNLTIEQCLQLNPKYVVISPGPCTPNEAGISTELIKTIAGKIPLLGVCLGHQCIGQAFGAEIVSAGEILHGKKSIIHHDEKGIFSGISKDFAAIRYHSLVIEEKSLPNELEISARSDSNLIMGVRNQDLMIEGIQFHPESIATEYGKNMIANFLSFYQH